MPVETIIAIVAGILIPTVGGIVGVYVTLQSKIVRLEEQSKTLFSRLTAIDAGIHTMEARLDLRMADSAASDNELRKSIEIGFEKLGKAIGEVRSKQDTQPQECGKAFASVDSVRDLKADMERLRNGRG